MNTNFTGLLIGDHWFSYTVCRIGNRYSNNHYSCKKKILRFKMCTQSHACIYALRSTNYIL